MTLLVSPSPHFRMFPTLMAMRTLSFLLISLLTISGCSGPETAFLAEFSGSPDRTWIGPQYYANRILDWELKEGRLQSIEGRQAKPMRTVHLLTHWLADEEGGVHMSVRTGAINEPDRPSDSTWVGFLIGAGGSETDYRISSLVHHWPAPGGG
jgi:alkaline phosphatase D